MDPLTIFVVIALIMGVGANIQISAEIRSMLDKMKLTDTYTPMTDDERQKWANSVKVGDIVWVYHDYKVCEAKVIDTEKGSVQVKLKGNMRGYYCQRIFLFPSLEEIKADYQKMRYEVQYYTEE